MAELKDLAGLEGRLEGEPYSKGGVVTGGGHIGYVPHPVNADWVYTFLTLIGAGAPLGPPVGVYLVGALVAYSSS